MTLSDAGLMFTGLATLVAAIAVLIAVVRNRLNHIKTQVGGVAIEIAQVAQAVNHQPGDAPSLVERVTTLERHAEWQRRQAVWQGAALRIVAEQIGAKLPNTPNG